MGVPLPGALWVPRFCFVTWRRVPLSLYNGQQDGLHLHCSSQVRGPIGVSAAMTRTTLWLSFPIL